MSRIPLALLILIAVSACGQGRDEAIIRQAESWLALPKGADPLPSYDRYRYYAISGRSANGILIRAEVLRAGAAKGKLVIVPTEKDLPFVADGGCGVIQVRLDLDKRKWERTFCHGM